MPASVAHMLIAHKALKELQKSKIKGLKEFAEMVDDDSEPQCYQAYMNQGSLGPDLYYYIDLTKRIKDFVIDRFFQAKAITPWAYHLHSNRPNEFPLRLIEITFSDTKHRDGVADFDVFDRRKLAYIAGHLSHIAADQMIHPLVNGIAGPYYKDGKHRKDHIEAEVYQDYFLYEEVYRSENESGPDPDYQFFKQDFRKWADAVRKLWPTNTEEWFRYFLQRGFIETYGTAPNEKEIEDAVDGLLMTFTVTKLVGPYKDANKEYKEYKKTREEGKNFKKYVTEPEYMKHYEKAVELTMIYVTALYRVYLLLKKADYKKFVTKKDWFLKVVSGADLSCPLDREILKKAKAALAKW